MYRLLKVIGSAIAIVAWVRLFFAGYIDPNTGGMLFQLLAIILASLTGTLLFFSRQIRITVARVKRVLRGPSTDALDPAAGRDNTEESK